MSKDELRFQAETNRDLLHAGLISREEAKEKIMPFIEEFNRKSVEIAKKWNQKPRKISFTKYIRQ